MNVVIASNIKHTCRTIRIRTSRMLGAIAASVSLWKENNRPENVPIFVTPQL